LNFVCVGGYLLHLELDRMERSPSPSGDSVFSFLSAKLNPYLEFWSRRNSDQSASTGAFDVSNDESLDWNTGSSAPSDTPSRKRIASPEILSDEQPKKKGRRARVACQPCKRAKQRCDNERPCARCVRRRKTSDCKDESEDVNIDDHEIRSDFTHVLSEFVSGLTPIEIHDLIVEHPLKWYALCQFGWSVRLFDLYLGLPFLDF
jgi:hypothetical protein